MEGEEWGTRAGFLPAAGIALSFSRWPSTFADAEPRS